MGHALMRNPRYSCHEDPTAPGCAGPDGGAIRGSLTPMDIVNLGILAHVDAGKTSLTERLLFNAGVIDHVGRVDDGDTQTDSLELERRRGITIRSAVVSFAIGDLQVNVIDTPGHSDFVAEVERALRVLDGAILVISAVEGVQARTRILMRSLVRLRIPVLLFVNKIDRMGARYDTLLESIGESLSPYYVAMGSVENIGANTAKAVPFSVADDRFTARLANVLADHGEEFVDRYLDDAIEVSADDYQRELIRTTGDALVYPVFFGSAITGQGIPELVEGISTLLPRAGQDVDAPLRASVFKVDRGSADEKIAIARVHTGTISPRDRLSLYRRDHTGDVVKLDARVTGVRIYSRGTLLMDGKARAGMIASLRGLSDARVGDQIGTAAGLPKDGLFTPPTLETLVRPARPEDRPALHAALVRMAEGDPLIDVHNDDVTGEISIRLFGEVQKEVIASLLAEESGIEVSFAESQIIYVEKPVGTGEALQEISMSDVNFFWATVGLRVEPGPPGSGVTFKLAVELGSLPLAFHKAIEESVRETLKSGLYGWGGVGLRRDANSNRLRQPRQCRWRLPERDAAGSRRSASPRGDESVRTGASVRGHSTYRCHESYFAHSCGRPSHPSGPRDARSNFDRTRHHPRERGSPDVPGDARARAG